MDWRTTKVLAEEEPDQPPEWFSKLYRVPPIGTRVTLRPGECAEHMDMSENYPFYESMYGAEGMVVPVPIHMENSILYRTGHTVLVKYTKGYEMKNPQPGARKSIALGGLWCPAELDIVPEEDDGMGDTD